MSVMSTDARLSSVMAGGMDTVGSLLSGLLGDDGRRAISTLSDARDQAGRLADGLDQLEAAGDGLQQVQKLVRQLRDIAVVAVDRGLQPADRATLQRQVDQALGEIDTTSEQTTLDEGLLRDGGPVPRPADDDESRQRVPFRAIGTAMLGLTGLAVRSSDQALAAEGALEIASTRLQRSAGALDSATVRLQDSLTGLTSPLTTATGGPALVGDTAAVTASILVRRQLLSNPERAADAQGGLEASRVSWLIESAPE